MSCTVGRRLGVPEIRGARFSFPTRPRDCEAPSCAAFKRDSRASPESVRHFFCQSAVAQTRTDGKASRSKTLLKGVVLEDSLAQNHSLYKTLYTQISERKPTCSTKAARRMGLASTALLRGWREQQRGGTCGRRRLRGNASATGLTHQNKTCNIAKPASTYRLS